MRTCSLIVLLWLSLTVTIPITAMAGEPEDKIFSISNIVKSKYMADGRDITGCEFSGVHTLPTLALG